MLLGTLSTASLASLSPRLVISRTTLMTWIFLAPPSLRTTVNSVFSSTGAAAAAPPAPPAGAAAAAAIVTLNLVLNASISSDNSTTVLLPIASRISSLLSVVVGIDVLSLSGDLLRTLCAKRLEGADHLIQHAIQHAGQLGHGGLHGSGKLRQQHFPRREASQPLDLIRRDRPAVYQADLDCGLLELADEVREYL